MCSEEMVELSGFVELSVVELTGTDCTIEGRVELPIPIVPSHSSFFSKFIISDLSDLPNQL